MKEDARTMLIYFRAARWEHWTLAEINRRIMERRLRERGFQEERKRK